MLRPVKPAIENLIELGGRLTVLAKDGLGRAAGMPASKGLAATARTMMAWLHSEKSRLRPSSRSCEKTHGNLRSAAFRSSMSRRRCGPWVRLGQKFHSKHLPATAEAVDAAKLTTGCVLRNDRGTKSTRQSAKMWLGKGEYRASEMQRLPCTFCFREDGECHVFNTKQH